MEKHTNNYAHELQKFNNYIQLIIESSSDIFALFDNEMKLSYCSNIFIKLMGLSDPNEIIGKPIEDVYKVHPDQDYVKRSSLRFYRIRHENDLIIEDDIIDWPHKGKRLYQITYKRLHDENGNFNGVIIVLHDVTDLRLEESKRRINDILQTAIMPCLVWDTNGNTLAYNREAFKTFVPQDQEDQDDLSQEEFNKFFLSSQPEYQPDGKKTEDIRQKFIRIALDRGFADINVQLKKIDGTPILFNILAARSQWLDTYRLIIYFHDLTVEKILESEAKEANERMKLMFDGTPIICTLRDEHNNIIDCNQEALKIFGVSQKSDFLANYYSFYPEFQPDGKRSIDKMNGIVQDSLKSDDIEKFEWMFQTANGEPLPVETKFVRINWKNTNRWISYSIDLRETKAKEQKILESIEEKHAAQAASEAKSQFLANMSHEIRTPLNVILASSELLILEGLDKRLLKYVENVKTSSTLLMDIINDILDFSKIQSGKLNIIPIHYYFETLLDYISSTMNFLTQDKDIDFRLEVEGEMPPCLYGDDNRLKQILLNILNNAVKFTDEGHICLDVTITDTNISFTISDTGMGIREEDIPMIFEAFEQFDELKNRNKKGTGLGLAIVMALVKMMDGEITVKSVYGQGSTFNVVIPKNIGDKALVNRIDNDTTMISAPNAKILLVDDNVVNLNVTRSLLELYKIIVDTATSGQQAITLASQNKYDLIFMDYMMPEMNGIETTQIIRENDIDTPIIALTANALAGTKEMMLAAGMNDYLSKPIIMTSLNYILKSWIPIEKQIENPNPRTSTPNMDTEEQAKFWETIAQIEEISIEEGLEKVAGQRGIYERSLKLMTKELEKCIKNLNEFLMAGHLHKFCIEVHSIKGSLANIGATELSAKALELEKASSQNDIDFCTSNLPAFLENLSCLNSSLKKAFTIKKNGPIEIHPELPAIFEKLKNALDEMDFIAIDKEIDNLNALNLNDALKDKVEEIKDAVLTTDHNGAVEMMNKLLSTT